MEDRISFLLVLIPALPLAAAVITAVLGPRVLRQWSHVPVIVAFAVAFLCSTLLLSSVWNAQDESSQPRILGPTGFEHTVTLWNWAAVEGAYRQAETPLTQGSSDTLPGGLRDFRIGITLRADALTSVMLAMVTFVSTLVAIFGAGYMHGDRGYWRFFSYVSLFVFSMTMLVSVSNFVLLFVFWEAVGVCSYLLIGFWYTKSEAADAGKKAFLVNRVGDFGFALGIFLIWTTYGTLNFHDSLSDGSTDRQLIAEHVRVYDGEAATPDNLVHGVLGEWRIRDGKFVGGGIAFAICALLLVGACGKSAQFPLHVWLPDAMEGPTPVSALIHAATMVTAGVYMIARCSPLFMMSPAAQLLVASIGGFTALLAALIALTQYDLKRVLAYSTISQLGFMFLGLGAGTFAGISAGMFHLFTHAFFKALLFLGAGSVMHAMGNVIDMRRFGGLRKIMPITHWTFFIGCLALAGFPGLSGFWSKDAIVAAIHDKSHSLHHQMEHMHDDHGSSDHGASDGHAVIADNETVFVSVEPVVTHGLDTNQLERYAAAYQGLYYLALFTALLTAFYTFRAFFMTFYGKVEVPHEAGHHAHESPPLMAWPLIALAVLAAAIGIMLDRTWQSTPQHYFADFLATTPSLSDGAVAETNHGATFHADVAATSSMIAVLGIILAIYFYLGGQREISWIRSLLDFEGFSRIFDVETVSRLKRYKWVAETHRFATRVGVGWLTSAIGQLILLLALILATPFLLGHYLSPYKISQGKFYLDEIYQLLIVWPVKIAAWVCYAADRWLLDGFVNAAGRVPVSIGSLMRSLQMGLVSFYGLAMVLGTLILIAAKVLWAG